MLGLKHIQAGGRKIVEEMSSGPLISCLPQLRLCAYNDEFVSVHVFFPKDSQSRSSHCSLYIFFLYFASENDNVFVLPEEWTLTCELVVNMTV